MQVDDLKELQAKLLADIANARDLAKLEELRISTLGKKGEVSQRMLQISTVPPDQRKAFGAASHQTIRSGPVASHRRVSGGCGYVEYGTA